MADHSLSLVVAEIAQNYSRSNLASVNSSFQPQKQQQEQINEGAAADILITSKESWIEELKLQGLIDVNSKTKLAGDRLVLISATDSPIPMQDGNNFPLLDIIKSSVGEPNFLVGNPETLMEGSYSREAVRNLGVSDDLEEYTLYVKTLEQIFDMVINNKAFALCFNSSVVGRKDVKVIYNIPPTAHKPITFYAVVIAGDNMDEARNFLSYLKSAQVNKIFRNYGFSTD